MPTNRRHLGLILTIALGLVAASCDKSPTRPTVQPTGTPGAPTPPAAGLVRIAIVAPASIEPGGSAQLAANAIKSDGSVENVTSQTQWTSTTAGVLQVNSAGIVTAGERGETNINARYQNRSATARIMVLPSGTFRLAVRSLTALSDRGRHRDGHRRHGRSLTTLTSASRLCA